MVDYLPVGLHLDTTLVRPNDVSQLEIIAGDQLLAEVKPLVFVSVTNESTVHVSCLLRQPSKTGTSSFYGGHGDGTKLGVLRYESAVQLLQSVVVDLCHYSVYKAIVALE